MTGDRWRGVKVLAIVSGGLDSTTMLWKLQSEGYDVVEVMSFDYGQRHSRELDGLSSLLDVFESHYGHRPQHQIVDLTLLRKLASAGALVGDTAVPHRSYDVETQKVTIVPNRNAVFINVAAARAVAAGYRYVAYAAHQNDHSVYPDCRPEFVEAMDRALELGNAWTPVNLLAPFVRSSKSDIVREALRLGVPTEKTWSCYEGDERPCLECGTCVERTQAFRDAGVQDPLLTDDEWERAVSLLKQ